MAFSSMDRYFAFLFDKGVQEKEEGKENKVAVDKRIMNARQVGESSRKKKERIKRTMNTDARKKRERGWKCLLLKPHQARWSMSRI